MPDGRIGHAELDFGGALMMLADEFPDIGHAAPRPGSGLGGHPPPGDGRHRRPRRSGGGRGRGAGAVAGGQPLRPQRGDRRPLRAPLAAVGDGRPPAPTRLTGGTRHGDVGYVSIHVPDLDRAQAFYGAVLGWTFAPAERPEARQVVGSAPMTGLSGGQERGDCVICWRVDDVVAAADRVRARGGTASEPVGMPYGTTSDCTDDQGMTFYLWQPTPEDAAATAGLDRPQNGSREGDLAYLSLSVVDSVRFRAFFGDVLGWTYSPGRMADGWNIEGPVPMTGLAGGADRASGVPMYRVDDIESAVERVRTAGGTATARRAHALRADVGLLRRPGHPLLPRPALTAGFVGFRASVAG